MCVLSMFLYLFECSYCGFNSITSFETIDDNDIGVVEQFVREELEDFVKSKAGNENQSMVEHFGEFYARCPKKFRFLPGDVKFIQKIKQHIHDIVHKKGPKKAFKHFHNKTNHTKDVEHTNEMGIGDQVTSSEFLDNELKKKLYNLILAKLIEFGVPESMRQIFDASFISIVRENNKTAGNIICVVCHIEGKDPECAKPKHVYSRGKSWVISNFIKHFTRAHSDLATNNQSIDNGNIQVNGGNKIYGEDAEYEKNVADDIEDYVYVEQIDPLSHELNYSTESLQHFIANELSEMEKKFNDQISSQLIKVWNTVMLNGESQDQQVQCKCENGLTVSLDVVNIQKDGDCLFGSLAHQIYGYNLNSSAHKSATKNLRTDAVNYIKQNYEEFEQYLQGHIMEMEECQSGEAFGLNDIDDMDAKCKHLLNNCLVNSGFWASGESLKAVAHIRDVNIIVLYENGPMYCVHRFGKISDRTVVIAFRSPHDETLCRNHYDSVCNISGPEIYKIAKFVSTVLQQDSNLI